jgi:hypothetical protein
MRIGFRGTPTESRAPCVRNCTCASEGRGSALRRQRAEAGLKSLAHSCEARRTLCAPYISNYRLSAFSDLNMLDSHELGPAVPLKKIANRHDDLAERPLRSNMIRPQYGRRLKANAATHRLDGIVAYQPFTVGVRASQRLSATEAAICVIGSRTSRIAAGLAGSALALESTLGSH